MHEEFDMRVGLALVFIGFRASRRVYTCSLVSYRKNFRKTLLYFTVGILPFNIDFASNRDSLNNNALRLCIYLDNCYSLILTSMVYVPPGVIGAGPSVVSSLLGGDMMVVERRVTRFQIWTRYLADHLFISYSHVSFTSSLMPCRRRRLGLHSRTLHLCLLC